jgi:hypothetical protein
VARTPRWTRESAIQYLAGNPDFVPTKPFDGKGAYTDAYLKRTATQLQDAERAGRAAPTVAQRRGHARAKVEHIPRDPKKHLLDQYRIVKSPKRELDIKDLQNLFNKTPKDRQNFFVTIHGLVKYKGTVAERTLNQAFDRYQFAAWLKEHPDGTVLDFANDVFDLPWEAVYAVGMSYPAKWS